MFKDNSKDKQGRMNRRTVRDEIAAPMPNWRMENFPDLKTLEALQKQEEEKVVSRRLIFKPVAVPDKR